MNSKKLSYMALAAVSLTLAITLKVAAQEQQPSLAQHTRYRIKVLPIFGGTYSQAGSINNHGAILGSSTLAGDSVEHAFLWHRGVMTDLGTLGGPDSSAVTGGTANINAGGVAVGFAETSTPDPLGEQFFCGFGTGLTCLPFVWHNGTMTPLPTLGGNNGFADSINDQGIATGLAETSFHDPTCVAPQVLQYKPAFWAHGKAHELVTLPGDTVGEAESINNNGDIVGATFPDCSGSAAHAVLWHRGKPYDMGTLGGTFGSGVAINNLGQVVGSSNLAGDETNHAFLWTRKNGMQDLGTVGQDTNSLAIGNNDNGQAVGISCDSGQENCRAFIWEHNEIKDLNQLVVGNSHLYLYMAYDVNDSGRIVGLGLTENGTEERAFVAIPCDNDLPEADGCGPDAATESSAVELTPAMKVLVSNSIRRFIERRPGLRFHQRATRSQNSGAAGSSVDYLRDTLADHQNAAQVTSGTSGISAPANSCPLSRCSQNHTPGPACGVRICRLPGFPTQVYKGVDRTLNRPCWYGC